MGGRTCLAGRSERQDRNFWKLTPFLSRDDPKRGRQGRLMVVQEGWIDHCLASGQGIFVRGSNGHQSLFLHTTFCGHFCLTSYAYICLHAFAAPRNPLELLESYFRQKRNN